MFGEKFVEITTNLRVELRHFISHSNSQNLGFLFGKWIQAYALVSCWSVFGTLLSLKMNDLICWISLYLHQKYSLHEQNL